MTETVTRPGRPRRAIGPLDLVALGINGVVGTGIFVLPATAAALMGPGALLAYVVCALLCLALAYCFAEMSAMFRESGGAYLYARASLGPFIAYLVGWMMWIVSLGAWAVVAKVFVFYLAFFIPELDSGGDARAAEALLIFILGALNYIGVRSGTTVNNILMLVKTAVLLCFVAFGLFALQPARLVPFFPHGLVPLGRTVLILLFAFTGFEVVTWVAGEARDPQRHVPRTLFITLGGATILYLLIQLVAQGTLPGLGDSERPLADAALGFIGPGGAMLLALGAVLSAGGINAGIALTSPRMAHAMARNGQLPAWLGRVHPRFATPAAAIMASSVIAAALVVLFDFEHLILFTVVATFWQYIPTCLALLILRHRRPDLPRSFRVPGGPVIPVIAIGVCLVLLKDASFPALAVNAAAVLVGIMLYPAVAGKSKPPDFEHSGGDEG